MTLTTSISSLFAQAPSGSSLDPKFLLMMGLMMAAMYFFLIAPQRKKDKEHKKMLSELKNGDRVITIGGIFGTITAVKEDRFHLKVDESTRIEVTRAAVQARQIDPSGGDNK